LSRTRKPDSRERAADCIIDLGDSAFIVSLSNWDENHGKYALYNNQYIGPSSAAPDGATMLLLDW
jgi:hypothetical protein